VHYVVFDKGTQRTAVLWNGSGGATRVSLPRLGESAVVVDKLGNETPLQPQDNRWVLTLEAASRRSTAFGGDPPGYFFVGGSPLLLVETGVPADAPVERPRVV
jgi:hypothetical protein